MASNKRPGPQLSRVWDYFVKVPNGHKCQLLLEDASPCEKVITNKVTHNAEEHVRIYHSDFYGDIDKEKQLKKQKKVTTKQATLPSTRQLTITDSFRGLSQSHFDEKLAKFFGGTTVSYNLINHPIFRDLIHSLNPNVKIPKSVTGVYTRVDKLFRAMKQKMRDDMKEAKKVTIMADIWTKRFLVDSFLGVSAVFFSRKAQKRRVVALAVRKFRHPHTAERICEIYREICTEYGIGAEKVFRIFTDNGSNVVKCFTTSLQDSLDADAAEVTEPVSPDPIEVVEATEILSMPLFDEFGLEPEDDEDEDDSHNNHNECFNMEDDDDFFERENQNHKLYSCWLSCYAHSLDLVAKKADFDADFLATFEAVQKITSGISHSSLAKQMIKDRCGRTLRTIPKPRWTYRYHFGKSVMACLPGVNAYCDHVKKDRIPVSVIEKLELCIKVLEPFAKYSGLLSMEKCPTLPGVLPSILSIESELAELGNNHSEISGLCEWLVIQLKERFDFVFNPKHDRFDPIYFLATLLQPEYCWVLDTNQITTARKLLKDLHQPTNDENSQSINVDLSGSAQGESDSAGVSLRFHGLEKRLRDKLVSQQQAAAETVVDKNPIDEQFERYFAVYGNASAARKVIDPLDFWISHFSEYPLLADFAIDLMCVPSGTAMQERIFSTCGIACSGRRLKLSGHQLEKETMITRNYDFYC